MELDEAVERDDGVVVLQRLIMREGGHQLSPRRPLGIGMLALDFVEQPRRLLEALLVHGGGGLGIDRLDRALHIGSLFGRGAGR